MNYSYFIMILLDTYNFLSLPRTSKDFIILPTTSKAFIELSTTFQALYKLLTMPPELGVTEINMYYYDFTMILLDTQDFLGLSRTSNDFPGPPRTFIAFLKLHTTFLAS